MTGKPSGKDVELKFPVLWRYRIIVAAAEEAGALRLARRILGEYDCVAPLTAGGVSSGGKYRTWLTGEFSIPSREVLETLSRRLADIPGVKFVL